MATMENSTHACLFIACEQGDLKTIESYLKTYSSSEIYSIRDENQATLLHYASRFGYLNILKYFMEMKHIDIGQLHTDHGATCVHDAAVCDQMEVLKYIFQHCEKLRWTVRDELGNTPLHLAARYNSLNVLHYLLEQEHADPHIQSYNGYQAIHYASEHGHYQCVKLLLLKSPDLVNQQTNQLLTPLHLACQNGLLETIQTLISHGSNFKLKDQNGLNCFHIACRNSHLNIVQWFVEKQKINIDEVDYINATPLHYAAASGNNDTINYLLDRQAKVISDNNGNTPLHVAAENGHQSACAILIERGCCSITSANSQQLTAIDLAENSGYSSLANELRLRANPSLLQKATVVRLVIKKRNVPRADASCQVNEEDLSIKTYSTTKINNQRYDFLETQDDQQSLPSNFEIETQNVQNSNLIKGDISTSTIGSNGTSNGHVPRSTVVAISKPQTDMPEWRRALIERRRNAMNGTK